MKIRMNVQLSGMRDGADWPKPGGIVDLPDAEAEGMVSAGLAARVTEPPAETATTSGAETTKQDAPEKSAPPPPAETATKKPAKQ